MGSPEALSHTAFFLRYRVAQKPVYQVQQKVLISVDWRCCPGFQGPDCQDHSKAPQSFPGNYAVPPTSGLNTPCFLLQIPQQTLSPQSQVVNSRRLGTRWMALNLVCCLPRRTEFMCLVLPSLMGCTISGKRCPYNQYGLPCGLALCG